MSRHADYRRIISDARDDLIPCTTSSHHHGYTAVYPLSPLGFRTSLPRPSVTIVTHLHVLTRGITRTLMYLGCAVLIIY